MIDYDDTSLTLERLDAVGPDRGPPHTNSAAGWPAPTTPGADAFGAAPAGWTGPGFFGPLQQPLPMSLTGDDSWGSFYADERLAPMAERAADAARAQRPATPSTR